MGGKVNFIFKFLLLGCLCLGLMGGIPGPTFAQEDDADEFVLQEIVVTGSRIARDSDASASPIVTVDDTLFDTSATVAIETALNKLPQFTPTVDIPTNAGDIQPNPTNTPGEATVALRGLGANRTLVLINGRRGTPSNAFGVLDINTIPLPAIEYVQAISGGASSTYGADAMSGVLNFIMKDSYQGLQLDAQAGVTQEGDNFEYQVGGVMGADFADDRGNVMLAFSFNKRQEALRKDRDFYRDLWADPDAGGDGFFPHYGAFVVDMFNPPDVGVLNTVIDGAAFFTAPIFSGIYADDNGQAFTGFGGIPGLYESGTSGTDIADGYHVKYTKDERYYYNFTEGGLIFPMDRYNVYTSGNYKINNYIGAFAQAYFSKVHTTTVQEPGPIFAGWSVYIDDPSMHQAAIPEEIWTILQSRPVPNASFQLNAGMPINRGTVSDVFTYNIVSGLEGDIPGIDWTWEAFVSRGEAQTTSTNLGVFSLQRLDAVMNGAPNFGQGFSQTGNAGPNAGFGAATATCTSGLNPFDWGSVSQDCWDAVKADLKTKQIMEQTIVEANAQGTIADLPAGELRGALGISTRENNYLFQNDTLASQGTSFLEQALGIYPTADTDASLSVDEGYAELLIPVLSDLPGFKQLNLELGARNSSYDASGSSWTYKALFDWRGNDWLRLRGGYNRAERAPNLAELYMAPLQTFAATTYGDVCSTGNGRAWSADPSVNPNWQNVVALCGQIMEAVTPTTDDQFYGADYRDIIAGTPAAGPGQAPGGPGFAFPFTVGNPALDPEKADTWTLGFVIDSPFDSPALSNLRISLDYYQIKVSDAIGEQSVDIVLRQCVDPMFNPTYDPNSPYCAGFKRNADGGVGPTERTYFNNGRFETSGLDLSIDWGMNAGPGRVGVNALINYLIDKKSAELDVYPLVDYAGTFGPTENGLNGNSYRYRSLTTLSYLIDDLNASLRWQHLSSIEMASYATDPDTIYAGAPAYDLFDLLGTYQLFDNFLLRFGVENVFDKKPPLIGQNTAATGGIGGTLRGGTYWTYGIGTAGYDMTGRRFYLGGRVDF